MSKLPLFGARILVVDDAPDLRRLYAMVCTHAGATVVQAQSGAQALSGFVAAPADVVVTDICMPDMSGIELLECLRALPQDSRGPTIVVATTGLAIDDKRHHAGMRAFDACLRKPVTSAALVAAIAKLLAQRAAEKIGREQIFAV